VGIVVRSHMQPAIGSGDKDLYREVSKPVSLGLGAYLSTLISFYFVFVSAKGWMAAKHEEKQPVNSSQQKAA
jgi:hypothetical protein